MAAYILALKLGCSFLSDMFRVRHVSNTDTHTTRISEMSNSNDIFSDN